MAWFFSKKKCDFASLDDNAVPNYIAGIKKRGDILRFARELESYAGEKENVSSELYKDARFTILMNRWIELSQRKKGWPKSNGVALLNVQISSPYSYSIGIEFFRDIYNISSRAKSDWSCDGDLREHIIKASELLNAYDPDNFRILSFEDCYETQVMGRWGFLYIKPIEDVKGSLCDEETFILSENEGGIELKTLQPGCINTSSIPT